MQVYPCMKKWHQMFGFGNGTFAPTGSIHGSIPANVLKTIRSKGKEQAPHLCFGASGKGEKRYEAWSEDKNKIDLNAIDFAPTDEQLNKFRMKGKIPPLRLWEDKYLVTIPCSDANAVVEFLFVPFIDEQVEYEMSEEDIIEDDLEWEDEDEDVIEDEIEEDWEWDDEDEVETDDEDEHVTTMENSEPTAELDTNQEFEEEL